MKPLYQINVLRSADPLDTNVSDINTDYPKVPANTIVDMQISEAKIEDNQKGTGQNLKFKLKALRPLTSVTGESVATFTLNHNISLTPTEKYSATDVAKNLAKLAKACKLSCTPREIITTPTMLDGKIAHDVKIGMQKESEEYPERNNVKDFVLKN